MPERYGNEVKMLEIIRIERKRILSIRAFLFFLAIVALFSIYSVYSILRSYEVPGAAGIAVTWNENLSHAKAGQQETQIDREFLNLMRQHEGEFTYVDERNLVELVAANYDGKSVRDLSDEDIGNFYLKRLSNIRAMLEESQVIRYTQEEIEQFMQSAGQVSEIEFAYAEGWKVLNDGMNAFVPVLLILISVLLLSLFGIDPKSNMTELYRSTKLGKVPLDHARVLAAYIIGVFLYLTGIALHFVIKMVPFGLKGGNQCIQSNVKTFFSLYNITNLQQFLLNVIVGLAALLFVISFLLFVTVIMEKIMTSAVVFVFFWILLLLFEQMYLWPVNHYFANFMPLRMTSFSHYYVGNEIYRMFGSSLSCMSWSVLVSVLLSGILLAATIGWEKVKRKRGLY